MKLRCKCDHIIVDQTDNLENKGYILPDTYVEDVSVTLTDNIDSLIEALKSDKRLSWIKNKFQNGYPTTLKDSSMIHDLVSNKIVETTQDIFECENCGRIAIQVGQTNQFKYFFPDSEETKGILKGKKK
ncbi:hypothetical protein [Croceimicrobium sp.]|uniref:hypothetical protein n=1 Tax=Croceimicrobium sp. TaxID=2828340 RepID=UPI003BABE589